MRSWLVGCAVMMGCGGGDPATTGDTGTSTYVPAGNDVPIDRFPPVVIATTPVSGTSGVSDKITEMSVEFSKPMRDSTWSWVQTGQAAFPKGGEVAYRSDTVNVYSGLTLSFDTAYLAWINDPDGRYTAFQGADGRSAVAFPLVFTTGTSRAGLDGLPTTVIRTSVVSGISGVDPAITEIEVEFSKDVDPTTATVVADGNRTGLDVAGMRGAIGRLLTLEVSLIPANTYAVWIEADAVDGSTVAPYLLYFRTGFGTE